MADLFRAAFFPGDTVWIEASDGHYYKGQVLAVGERYNYKKSKTRGNYKTGHPHKVYRVHTMCAKDIQPGGGRIKFQVMCTHNQLYPRTEISSLPPHLAVQQDMIQEQIKNEKLL
jgi:hypothetical protein